MTAAGPGRREIRRQANIEALLAAAQRLVLRQGDDFTTQDLIKEADVALQTFYRSFAGKDELFLAVVGELIAAHCDSLAKRAAALDGPIERLRFYVTDTITAMIANAGGNGPRFITTQHWRLQRDHAAALADANRPFVDLLRGALEDATEAGAASSDDPERDAWIINRLILSVVHHQVLGDEESAEATSVADDIWRFCSAAIGGSALDPFERQPRHTR